MSVRKNGIEVKMWYCCSKLQKKEVCYIKMVNRKEYLYKVGFAPFLMCGAGWPQSSTGQPEIPPIHQCGHAPDVEFSMQAHTPASYQVACTVGLGLPLQGSPQSLLQWHPGTPLHSQCTALC